MTEPEREDAILADAREKLNARKTKNGAETAMPAAAAASMNGMRVMIQAQFRRANGCLVISSAAPSSHPLSLLAVLVRPHCGCCNSSH
jgi:hypothetical protein